MDYSNQESKIITLFDSLHNVENNDEKMNLLVEKFNQICSKIEESWTEEMKKIYYGNKIDEEQLYYSDERSFSGKNDCELDLFRRKRSSTLSTNDGSCKIIIIV